MITINISEVTPSEQELDFYVTIICQEKSSATPVQTTFHGHNLAEIMKRVTRWVTYERK